MVAPDPGPDVGDTHWVLSGVGLIEQVRSDLPPLLPDFARVRVAYCGVCGSDRSYYSGERSTRLPRSIGHEWVGVVEAVGTGPGPWDSETS